MLPPRRLHSGPFRGLRGAPLHRRIGTVLVGLCLAVQALSSLPLTPAAAASPSSAPAPIPSETGTIVGPGDPRSEGEGAGLVGSPILVALGVIAIGLLASGSTLLYVRIRRGG